MAKLFVTLDENLLKEFKIFLIHNNLNQRQGVEKALRFFLENQDIQDEDGHSE